MHDLRRFTNVWVFGAALAFGLFVASAPASATTLYDDRSLWEAAAPGWDDVDIAGQVPDGFTLLAGDPLGMPSGASLSFDITLSGLQVPGSWGTWSGGNTPAVLYTQGVDWLTGIFDSSPLAFGMEVEPNDFNIFDVTLMLDDGSTLTLAVDGFAGAKFFGWVGAGVVAFEVHCDGGCGGFAIGRLVEAPVPEPTAPLLFGAGLLVAGWAIRRRTA